MSRLKRPELVIDAVLHAYNFDPANAKNEIARDFGLGSYAYLGMTGDNAYISEANYRKNWSIEEVADIVFTESDTDIGIYHAVPWFDYFFDGLVPNDKGIEMVGRWPNRCKFYGTLDPLKPDAVEKIDYLVNEAGAIGIKLYPENWHYSERRAEPVMLDAARMAPVLEKILELNVPVAVHKAVPAGHGVSDFYRVADVEQAAMRYPDLQIEVVHSGAAFLEDTGFLLERYQNVWANLEVTTAFSVRMKRRFYEAMSKLMASGASDRIIYATGSVLVHPQPVLEAFWDYSLPEDLAEGFMLPDMDQSTLDGIMGLNFCRLHGLDPQKLLSGIKDDEFAKKREHGLVPMWSSALAAT